jgi:hypothetical protein
MKTRKSKIHPFPMDAAQLAHAIFMSVVDDEPLRLPKAAKKARPTKPKRKERP